MELAIARPKLVPSEVVCDGWIHAYGDYYPRRNAAQHLNSPWSRAVLQAKRRQEDIIGRFGDIIASHLMGLLRPDSAYIITPVPGGSGPGNGLFRSNDRTTTEILADCIRRKLAGSLRIRTAKLLVQARRKTKSQHQCRNMAERAANVCGLYALRPGVALTGEGIVLVDDIITSGATMAECARILREAGAKEVIGLALARTVRFRPEDNGTGDLFAQGSN